jgi:hypothetical protein
MDLVPIGAKKCPKGADAAYEAGEITVQNAKFGE